MIKKVRFAAAMVIFCMVSAPLFAAAEETEETAGETAQTSRPEDMYSYAINDYGNAEIYDFLLSDSYQGELVIPSTLDDCPVTYLGNAAFMNAEGVTSITIPASLNDMGNSVFLGCSSLEKFEVEAGNGYFSVSDGVLYADSNMFLVAYPAAKSGETYQIPSTVDEIAPGCFSFAKYLTEITIPESVIYIDEWAFAYAELQKIVFSSTVVEIDEYAFAYCYQLSDVQLQAGLETIEGAAFCNCPALETIALPNTLSYVGQYAFCGTGMKSVTIPSSVTEIAYCAFGYDSDLNAIHDFVIYGESNTAAEVYATDSDDENDYTNNFTFIAIDNADEPQEETAQAVESAAAIADEEEVYTGISGETAETSEASVMTDTVSAELKGNTFLQILLATLGGIAVLLAIVLGILSAKKPKKSENASDTDAS